MVESTDPAYYNTVDQVVHVDWVLAKLARIELLRKSIATLWPTGHPTRMVHVAGTSGKGSVCRLLEAGFGTGGRAGAYLNPHLFDYRERFSIDGAPPPRPDVTAAWEEVVRPYCVALAAERGDVHRFAEAGLLMALTLFDRAGVEWAAVETGLGGRYAPSCALDVEAGVLTNVGDDHPVSLGTEPWQRALDKAGIARPGVPMFTAEQDPELLAFVAGVCDRAGAPLHPLGPADEAAARELLTAADIVPGGLLEAEVQGRNAALALAVLRHLMPGTSAERLVAGMAAVEFPGRLTEVEDGVFADIAHNPDKLAALAGEVERRFANRSRIFVVGLSGSRPATALLGRLVPLAKALIVTTPPYRGRPATEVAAELSAAHPDAPVEVIDDPHRAIARARELRGGTDVVVVTGSTYAVDAALNPDPYLRHLNATMGWRHRNAVPEPGQPPPGASG